jgi:predicted DNA repair protein MutK
MRYVATEVKLRRIGLPKYQVNSILPQLGKKNSSCCAKKVREYSIVSMATAVTVNHTVITTGLTKSTTANNKN